MKKYKAILTRIHLVIKDGKFVDEADRFEVVVMAIVGRYAMVRRPRAIPFVCTMNELATTNKEEE